MNIEKLSKNSPAKIGFLQFFFGFLYISLVATFFWAMSHIETDPPQFLIALLMLTLLTVSATVMGIIFFGVPVYLVLKNNWSKALHIFGFTLAYAVLAIVILATIIFLAQI